MGLTFSPASKRAGSSASYEVRSTRSARFCVGVLRTLVSRSQLSRSQLARELSRAAGALSMGCAESGERLRAKGSLGRPPFHSSSAGAAKRGSFGPGFSRVFAESPLAFSACRRDGRGGFQPIDQARSGCNGDGAGQRPTQVERIHDQFSTTSWPEWPHDECSNERERLSPVAGCSVGQVRRPGHNRVAWSGDLATTGAMRGTASALRDRCGGVSTRKRPRGEGQLGGTVRLSASSGEQDRATTRDLTR